MVTDPITIIAIQFLSNFIISIIDVVRLQMNSMKRHTTLNNIYLHLYCTYIQDGKYTEKMVQAYRLYIIFCCLGLMMTRVSVRNR
jgi:hypothetical protein